MNLQMKILKHFKMNNQTAIYKTPNKQPDLYDLEKKLSNFTQRVIPITHTFMGGIYLRTMHMPANTWAIGKRHRYKTCNMLISGELSMYMGKGIPAKRIVAPCIFESEPYQKKMFYTHTDVIFTNFHPTMETNLEKIEKKFIIPEEEYKMIMEDKKNKIEEIDFKEIDFKGATICPG